MTFMLSNVRSSVVDNRDDVEQRSLSGTKRKSLSFLPSSPTKLKRIDRSHSRSSSLLLLSNSSPFSRLSSFYPSKRPRPSPKSPPTCTISFENVTVSVRDEGKNLSRVFPRTTPLESIDVNVIPFPTASPEASEPTSVPGPPIGRRRRSNHLLSHRRSSAVHSISGKENPSFSAFSSLRQPAVPRRSKSTSPGAPSQPARNSLSFKDVRFIALIKRSILHGIIWRERMDQMDVDNEGGSGSVTFDILNESESDEGDKPSETRFMHNQDILLADRLGKQLADWGYRERDLPTATISSICPLRMPLAPVALPAVSVYPPLFSPIVDFEPSMDSTSGISIPDLQDHATHASFLNEVENIPMDVDGGRPLERPVSPVARCLEPTDENDAPISSIRTGSKHSRKPMGHPIRYPPSRMDDAHKLAFSGHHMPTPTRISSSPPLPPISPGPPSSQQRVLGPSHLVATLVMRHREKMSTRSRGTPQVGNRTAGRGTRKPSPLACELWAEVEK
ncbi:hypothetical protein D9757_002103 [Collybiopsis confluens]|uniref:Uncharacterized protein n=1 Tax=Collybiopsis confluens TaxID=2823264 RepID=A0A8H5I0A5_9AGAR|nr:hypothetical protein D9757_014496 [Collybiopsis confluens]KAF5392445.1 hypothetical protein D9757_002103 [Collybiopsis confluens]